MISFINIVEPVDDPTWKRWRKACDIKTQELKDAVAAGQSPTIKKLYKRKSIKDKFYFSEDGPFHGKCGFCETYLTQFQNPDIEHFRPKLGVTDENDAPIKVDYGNGEVDHIGYYWLAYEWKNLLPSCAKCNQASVIDGEKIGKHNRFPTEDIHARDENEIPQEHPLLINPLVENPNEFIRVNTKDGLLEPINESLRGRMTIDILGLNTRSHLQKRRQGKIREVTSLLVELMHKTGEEQDKILRELIAMKNGRGEYTATVRTVLDERAAIFQALI